MIRARTALANKWIARELALGHVTSVSRYCSDKFKHRDLRRFMLSSLGCAVAGMSRWGARNRFARSPLDIVGLHD